MTRSPESIGFEGRRPSDSNLDSGDCLRRGRKGAGTSTARQAGFACLCLTLAVAGRLGGQTITEYPLPDAVSRPNDIVVGPDGALWFTEAAKIGRITTAGHISEFPIPTEIGGPGDIAVGPDGAFWFTICNVYLHEPVNGGSKIGRVTRAGEISAFPLPTPAGCPTGIAAGPDGNLWFTELFAGKIGRITPSGTVSEFPMPKGGSPESIAHGKDGNLWYSATISMSAWSIGRITTAGDIVEFPLSKDHFHCPHGLTSGPDGNVWFAEGCTAGGAIGRITPSGAITEFAVPTANAWPQDITTGPDGALWFTEQAGNKIGRVTVDGLFTEFPLPGAGSYLQGITAGPDGAIWFAEWAAGANRIGRITVPGYASQAVTLTPGEVSLRVGESRALTATLSRTEPSDTPVTLTVSEDGVLLVPSPIIIPTGQTSKSFEVTGLRSGTTQVTAALSGGSGGTPATVTVNGPDPLSTQVRFVPIALDVTTALAHFTTELALTNTTSTAVNALLTYTASLGYGEGSGTVLKNLGAGEQVIIADVIAALRAAGLAIPDPTTGPQGGTLRVEFHGSSELRETSVGTLARTTTATIAPQPVGSAGLAYAGLASHEAITGSAMIFGLRATGSDRSNVALFNTGAEPVSVKVTLTSGADGGSALTYREAETLPPYGWLQFNSSDLLGAAGLTNAFVKMERVSASGSFGAYAVINDNTTSDGSFLVPAGGSATGTALSVPVLVETPSFRSELVLSNSGTARATLQLRYVESLTPGLGAGGTTKLELSPGCQVIIPEAVDYLRGRSVAIGPKDQASYVGSLRITVSGVSLGEVFAAARTAALSPAGGQFGLFTPAVYEGQEATYSALLLGLRDDAMSRSNVAVVNVGSTEAGGVTLSLQAFDGEAGGLPRGESEVITLAPGGWQQWGRFLGTKGVRSGWVEVTRTAGSAPWIAYGVINDGAWPGERTGDGAYVPMVVGTSERAAGAARR